MNRSLAELEKEARVLGIDVTGFKSKEDFMNALALIKGGPDSLTQLDVMLCRDAKEMQDYDAPVPWLTEALRKAFWENPRWVAELKLDGCRAKIHFTPDWVRVDSRNRSVKTYLFDEKTPNFPHIQLPAEVLDNLVGTVLDSEALMPVADDTPIWTGKVWAKGTLPVTVATMNAGPEASIAIQKQYGWMEMHVFDILRFRGVDMTRKPFHERRAALEKVVSYISRYNHHYHLTQMVTEDKLAFYESVIGMGGEGVIFKDRNAPYDEGKRSKAWYKLKAFHEVDVFVTDWYPGEHGFTGMVGSLEMSVVGKDGKPQGVAAVGQFTLEERELMTGPGGTLEPEYYGKVAVIRGQTLTKTDRFRHAVFITWRSDKDKEDCTWEQL